MVLLESEDEDWCKNDISNYLKKKIHFVLSWLKWRGAQINGVLYSFSLKYGQNPSERHLSFLESLMNGIHYSKINGNWII